MANLFWTALLHNLMYTGNTESIASLHTLLKEKHIVAVSGLRGMGKSEMVVEYIGTYQKHHYQAVIWLNASSLKSLNADLLLMSQIEPRLANYLWMDNEETLLILDNAQDVSIVKDLVHLQKWRGHIIVTTRFAQSQFPVLTMPLLSLEESTLLVLRRGKLISEQGNISEAGEADRQVVTEIAREMCGFPLALDQAGTYLAEVGCSPTRYLSLYQNHKRKVLGIRSHFSSSRPNPSLVDVIEETVHCLPLASQKFLRALASSPPDTMEWQSTSYDNKTLDDLRRAFLIQPCTNPRMFSMHPLVRIIVGGKAGTR